MVVPVLMDRHLVVVVVVVVVIMTKMPMTCAKHHFTPRLLVSRIEMDQCLFLYKV
jgi:hypothetical protein